MEPAGAHLTALHRFALLINTEVGERGAEGLLRDLCAVDFRKWLKM